jgi:23S rRNA pseudouridine1911/1915/1917 synthase
LISEYFVGFFQGAAYSIQNRAHGKSRQRNIDTGILTNYNAIVLLVVFIIIDNMSWHTTPFRTDAVGPADCRHRPCQTMIVADVSMTPEDFKIDRHFFYDTRWSVFFEDNHLLAVYKPAGLLVQGDRSKDVCLLDLAKQWLKLLYHKPGKVFLGMVHRLDRPVAGVVLFARTSKAASRLSRQFRERTVKKTYLAVVEGTMPDTSGCLRHHIERGCRHSRVLPDATPHSKTASLHYEVLGHDRGRSLVRIGLETGRRHQIRIQLAHTGCPILGDRRYGSAAVLPNREIALLANHLEVDHPTRGQRLVLTCPLPDGWPWPDAEDGDHVRPPWDWRAFDFIFNRVF